MPKSLYYRKAGAAMKLALLLSLALLAGCASYGKPEATHINLHVNYTTHDEFTILKTKMGVNPFYDAFAKWYDEGNVRHCFVFLTTPSVFVLGHEVGHCVHGNYHSGRPF